MRFSLLLFVFLLWPVLAFSQDAGADYTWWNELHGWEEGDPGWRNWMKITPGFFGPNALPVPHVTKGLIAGESEIGITASSHFLKGDPTQDLAGRIFLPFAKNKIAVEMYGVFFERFAFSEEIRNERIARVEDGKGTAIGDFYFATHIQVAKDRKFPNTLFRFATRTTSGSQLEAARYTDHPGYFLDLSFSEVFGEKAVGAFTPFGSAGFYTWQTNDELNLQNDAFMYALGADYEKNDWLFSASWSGYSGYKNERDRPAQINFDVTKDFGGKALKLQYVYGLRHWEYKTVRVSFTWKLKALT